MDKIIKVKGYLLQENPLIYFASTKGRWLLKHTTPVWRIKDPKKGFQRIVKEERARKIAVAVLDQKRAFPNAIVLATDIKSFEKKDNLLIIKEKSKFLVVDGQHRLWAQNFSEFNADYACLVHCGLTEVDMAKLFLEINDNQKRVPSSLRWDLVRLVRPDDDPYSIVAVDLIYELSEAKTSPLYQRIDLTGEQGELELKQGSLAPEIKNIVSQKSGKIRKLSFEQQYDILERYFEAIKSLDSSKWNEGKSVFYKNRILRVLLRLLPEILKETKTDPIKTPVAGYRKYLTRIDKASLATEAIKAKQGGAGMKEIYNELKTQIFRKVHKK